jgi:hypothetical protein
VVLQGAGTPLRVEEEVVEVEVVMGDLPIVS